jgi:membrane carboxypeptidase/penicillin-binding protein
MASAYGVFANGGRRVEPLAVLKVTDIDGRVLEVNESRGQQIISPQNAYVTTDMLTGVMQPGGTGSHLTPVVGRTAAGKTGTTQEYRDAWFAGFTPELSCAVWVGYDSQTKSVGIPGGSIAGPIWAQFMASALDQFPKREFTKPQGIVRIRIDSETGLIATESCPRTMEAAFLTGSEPQDICYEHQPSNNWWDWGNLFGGRTSPQKSQSAPRLKNWLKWWNQVSE